MCGKHARRKKAGKGRKRLAENESNMADHTDQPLSNQSIESLETPLEDISEEERVFLKTTNRPIYNGFKLGRILCPNKQCIEELQFFDPNGIHHHFRIRHKCDFTDDLRRDSSRICRTFLEEETKTYLEKLFILRETMVRISLFCDQ